MQDYLYIFPHIPKTGGSSFRKHLEKNIPKNERVLFEFKDLRYGKRVKKRKKLVRKRAEKEISKLSDRKKAQIKFVYGHGACYGVHKHFDKPARYITFLREPNKRALSLYNFIVSNYKRDSLKGITRDNYEKQLLVDGKIPSFQKWVEVKYGVKGMGVDTATQLFEDLGYLSKGDSVKSFLDIFYFIGITKGLTTDLEFLYQELGFNKFFVRQNITKKTKKAIGNKKTRQVLEEKNKKDYKLYKKALEKNSAFRKDKNYFKKAERTRIKKFFLLPLTQIVFDPKGTLIDLSAFLRRKSKIYEKTFDYLRGYSR